MLCVHMYGLLIIDVRTRISDGSTPFDEVDFHSQIAFAAGKALPPFWISLSAELTMAALLIGTAIGSTDSCPNRTQLVAANVSADLMVVTFAHLAFRAIANDRSSVVARWSRIIGLFATQCILALTLAPIALFTSLLGTDASISLQQAVHTTLGPMLPRFVSEILATSTPQIGTYFFVANTTTIPVLLCGTCILTLQLARAALILFRMLGGRAWQIARPIGLTGRLLAIVAAVLGFLAWIWK